MTNALDGWGRSEFTADNRTRQVFRRGTGPGVIVVHEISGITPTVAAFANDVVAAGFTVVMPSLVGTPGKAMSGPYGMASLLKVCIAREFTTWAMHQTSPIISWLRALATDLHASAGGPGVGAVSMCFSGGFALGMMTESVMVAPVLSQPSLRLRSARRRGEWTSICRRPTLIGSRLVPRPAARCWACGSTRTSRWVRGSTRCARCSATRSSPSTCRARRRATTPCSPSSATRRPTGDRLFESKLHR